MVTVEVSKRGKGIGTVSFRGIAVNELDAASALPTSHPEKRLFRCSPTKCVSKDIARRIANNLTFGVQAGQEDDVEWHT